MSAKKKTANPHNRGFTLIELLVVVSIISILSIIGLAVFTNVQKNTRDAKRRGDIKDLSSALEQYKLTNGTGYTLATTFPCPENSWNYFSDMYKGAVYEGASSFTGCPASVYNALRSYFSSKIPNDPLCDRLTIAPNNSACNVQMNWNDYAIRTYDNGQYAVIYARLEDASGVSCNFPVPPTGCDIDKDPDEKCAKYNYCIRTSQ